MIATQENPKLQLSWYLGFFHAESILGKQSNALESSSFEEDVETVANINGNIIGDGSIDEKDFNLFLENHKFIIHGASVRRNISITC